MEGLDFCVNKNAALLYLEAKVYQHFGDYQVEHLRCDLDGNFGLFL